MLIHKVKESQHHTETLHFHITMNSSVTPVI